MKGNGFDFRALYDQCESLRRDTINLLKDNSKNVFNAD